MECRVLVVQKSSAWLSKYISISLDFLLGSKFVILKEGLCEHNFSLEETLVKFHNLFKRDAYK